MLSRYLFVAAFIVVVSASKLGETNNPTICDPSVRQYSGYFEIDPTTQKKYFYWAFSSRSKPSTDPVVLWMTGGPGCSSEVALFGENGPCKVDQAGDNTINNTFSWNSNANLVYIDQPAGVGFSTASIFGYDSNEVAVANDMYAFLQAFFGAHPEWVQNDFYVFGESYGGHYAPAVSHRIWQGNQNGTGIKINLKGVGIGNGLTDPQIQYGYYAQLAYNWSIQKTGQPVISLAQYQSMTASIPSCTAAIAKCNTGTTVDCIAAQEECNLEMLIPYQLTGMNPYDIRIKCAVPPLCYDMSNIGKYLNTKTIQAQLGVSGTWQSCNQGINMMFALAGDWMKNYQTMLPDLLGSGIRVLIYAGDCDFICNWLGNKAWTLQMDWTGRNAFNAASDLPYLQNGTEVGKIRSASGFTFLQVYNAGHMVPMDQPAVALGMLNKFIFNQ
jgi:cathepsin A (carboxypeptidase C)